MKGNLIKKDNLWFIEYQQNLGPNVIEYKKVRLHPSDSNLCNIFSDYSVDWINKEIRFELINEKNDDGSYTTYGRTISTDLDDKLDLIHKEYSENLMDKNFEKWEQIFDEYQNLNKQELINVLKTNYFYPIKIPN